MKRLFLYSIRRLMGAIFILSYISTLHASAIYKNENIIGQRVVDKINQIANELKQKTGVNAYVMAIKSTNGLALVSYEEQISQNFKEPFFLLSLVLKEHQVDIIASQDVMQRFDKNAVLSPYPASGTIIPILADKKGDDKYSAALLNGFGDISDQIANSYNVKLSTSIGSANKFVLNIIRVIFYGTIIFAIFFIYFKRKKRNGKSNS